MNIQYPAEYYRNRQYGKIVNTMFADIHTIAIKANQDAFASKWKRINTIGEKQHFTNQYFKEVLAVDNGISTELELRATEYLLLDTWQGLYN